MRASFFYAFAGLVLTGGSLARAQTVGAVYTLSNAADGNAVMAFDRDAQGRLTFTGAYPTGGLGNGSGLGSQNALVQSHNGQRLLAVNAGSNDVSVFAVSPMGLVLTDVEPSLGPSPTSVSLRESKVYVLNAGEPNSVTGFTLSPAGELTPVARAVASLSGSMTDPAQVGIAPGAMQLFVSERATNTIDIFPIQADGTLGVPEFVPSVGATPFGFEFTQGDILIVSEAFGGDPDESAVSSYAITGPGMIDVISPSVPTTETAACWIAITRGGRFAYATNTGSGTVTGYSISPGTGAIASLDANGITGDLGRGTNPLDAAITRDNRFLYVVSPATGEIAAFFIRKNGSLEKLQSALGLPTSAAGLVAR